MMGVRKSAVLLAALLALLLSACGGDAAGLREENAALREKTAALERDNAALQEQCGELQNQLDRERTKDNPIDSFYDAADTSGTTIAMNAVSGQCADAWEREARNAAMVLKDSLPLEEDRALVDAYLAAAETQVEYMKVMAIYPVSDLETPAEKRAETSGSLRGVLWGGSRAQIWRDAFYQIQSVMPYGAYAFLFDEAAARAALSEFLS